MVYDCHLHTNFSGDCDVAPEIMIEQGIKNGLTGICMTDHQDADFPYPKIAFDLDLSAYYKKYQELKTRYGKQLDLLFGVELGIQPHLAAELSDYVKSYPFDFIIGSIHLVNRIDPWYPDYFEGRDDRTAFIEYFECALENLKAFRDFDVFGHLDYIIRYSPNKNKNYSYEAFRHIIDEILKILVENGIGLEINTGSIKSGLDTPNPCKEILLRYKEMGGEILTFGSDAHKPEFVGYKLKEMQELAKECGFKYFSTFKERKPKMHLL